MQIAMNLKIVATALAAGMFAVTGTGISQAKEDQLSPQDKQFITDAAQGGIGEVEMGQLAAKQAQDEN